MMTYWRAATDSTRAFRSLEILEIKFTRLTQQMSLVYYVLRNFFSVHIFVISNDDDGSQVLWFYNEKDYKVKCPVVKDTKTNNIHF